MARMRKRGSHAAPDRPARPDQDGTGSPPAAGPPAGPASDGAGPGPGAWPPGWAVTSPPPNGAANGMAEHGVAEHGVTEHPVAEHGRPGNGLVGHGTPHSGTAGNGALGNGTLGNAPLGNGTVQRPLGGDGDQGHQGDGAPAAFGGGGTAPPRAWRPPQRTPWFPEPSGPAPRATTPPATDQ